jgi:hypothetical protein
MMRRTLAILALLPAVAIAQTDKAAAEQSLKQIEAFTTMQARTDPHYLAVEDALLGEVDEIVTKSPPREWLPCLLSPMHWATGRHDGNSRKESPQDRIPRRAR